MKPSLKEGDIFTSNQGCTFRVARYVKDREVYVEFLDSHRHIMKTNGTAIKKGRVKNPFFPSVCGVGFLGCGKHKAVANGSLTAEYKMWRGMIYRCYLEKRSAAYVSCSVCSEWLNFQNFADWLSSYDFKEDDWDLDKDMLGQGKKIYSPENCALVPREINSLVTDRAPAKTGLPLGVYKGLRDGTFRACITMDGEAKHLGVYGTPEEAHRSYVAVREEYVRSFADKWDGRVDPRVISALKNWTAPLA